MFAKRQQQYCHEQRGKIDYRRQPENNAAGSAVHGAFPEQTNDIPHGLPYARTFSATGNAFCTDNNSRKKNGAEHYENKAYHGYNKLNNVSMSNRNIMAKAYKI